MSTNVLALKTGAPLSPIYPQSIEEVYRLSKMALTSGMLKPQKTGYGDNAVYEDADAVLARGTMIIMQGMELGVPPMQAIQLLAMINGRIVAHSEAVPGLLLAKGFKIKETWSGAEMSDDWKCTVELTRPNGEKHTASFSVKDAKQAGLWDQSPTKTSFGKTKPNDSAWYRYPKRMLKARALGFAGKDGGADALKGIQIQEEAEDMARVADMRDVTPTKNEMLEIPDIPDVSQIDDTQASAPEASQDEPLADGEGFLAKLEEDIALCTSVMDLEAVAESNKDLIARLSKDQQERAEKMLSEAAE
jgi:hypothetical protein